MSAFALNSKYIPDLHNRPLLKIGDTGSFSIESELSNIPIRKNSHFVVIRPNREDLVFTNEGTVVSIAAITKLPPSTELVAKAKKNNLPLPKDKYRHTFDYKIERPIDHNNALSDLKYSLKVVYNFYKPESHFSQQFRELNSEDYKTIINGWIYNVRTAFGKIVNSLPRQNRLEFMLHAMEEFNTIDFIKVPLLDGIDFLNGYVARRILSRGKILVATDKLIHSKMKSILDPKQVGFVDEIKGSEKNIHTQALIFEKLLSLQNKVSLKDYLRESVNTNSELEAHFEKMFRKETWPIDLRA